MNFSSDYIRDQHTLIHLLQQVHSPYTIPTQAIKGLASEMISSSGIGNVFFNLANVVLEDGHLVFAQQFNKGMLGKPHHFSSLTRGNQPLFKQLAANSILSSN